MKKITILESLRGFASLYVAAGHFVLHQYHLSSILKLLFSFGQEAVIIFFILSGFVIFFSYDKSKDKSLGSYFLKRFRRIYFPLLCAFIVSYIVVNHGFSLKELVGNVLMLQDFATGKPGNIVAPFMGNTPLWSLSYEWMFYLIFPFIFPVIENNKNRVHIVGIFCLFNLIIYILFPNHIFVVLSYFLIWWTGLELGEYFSGISTKFQHKTLIGYYVLFLLILGLNCFLIYRVHHVIQPGIYPYLLLRHFAFAFFCLLATIYFTSITKKLVGLIKVFSHIAPISYSIYILHYPLLILANFNMPIVPQIILKLVLLFGLAYLIEIVLQPHINKLLNKIFNQQPYKKLA